MNARRPLPEGFSDDQRAAAELVIAALRKTGLDLPFATPPERAPKGKTFALLGKAGSGKTYILSWLSQALADAGARQVTGEVETKSKTKSKKGIKSKKGKEEQKSDISFAVVAPTNRAASVLRARGVAATTIHRVIYSPIYDPEFEALAEWLGDAGSGDQPVVDGLDPQIIERALSTYKAIQSAPAAMAAVGIRGSDFITGWQRRDESLTIGLVDESSMLDQAQLDDLQAIFDLVVLFGDPAQLAPVGEKTGMVFDRLPATAKRNLARVHRQTADNPILALAHALQEDISFRDFEALLKSKAQQDDRVQVRDRVDCDIMARSPALVWRNATRIRMINAFRVAFGLGDNEMSPGEPLICDGLELPAKNRHRRVDLEQAGLVKGAAAYWLGEGRRAGFAQLFLPGAPQPKVGVSAIIQI